MSEEFPGDEDVTRPDSELMEGLLFDLGIFGDYPAAAALGGPPSRPRSGPAVGRTPSTGPTFPASAAPLPVTAGFSPSFTFDPSRQLTEKSTHDIPG